jgi:hypothetical protein
MINVQQITSKLRMMPDQQLQHYAMQNKDDPYTVSLALSEANTRKQMRSNQQAKMAGMQQPTVVDQDIAEMAVPQQMPQMPQQAPQQMAQAQLPENVGIGQLPAQNMQRMADGGIVGYADKGAVKGDIDTEAYRKYALERAQTLGLDPMWVDRILSHESTTKRAPKGYDPEAVSPTGPTGIGQLARTTASHYMKQLGHLAKGEKFDPDMRKDPYKNIDASLAFMSDLKTKYNNDPQKMAIAYNQGEPYLNKHLAENKGELNIAKLKDEPRNYLSKTGNMPLIGVGGVGTTQAGAPAAPVAPAQPSALSQIPTGGVPGAGPTAPGPDTRSYFGRVADDLGISEETQRNINNTLSALGGWTAPAAGVSKGVGIASKGLAATPEMLAKAEQLKNATALTRLAPPVAKGIEALAPEAQATRAAAENARRVRQMSEDVNAAKGAEQSIKAADTTSKLALETEKALAAQQQARMIDSAKLANVGRATTGMQAIDAMQTEPRATGLPMDDLGYDRSGLDALDKADKKELVDVAKASLPKGKGSDYGNDFLLMLGLGLMGGQSPNALTNLGQAGIGALKHVQESRKDEADRLYKESLAKHYGVPNEVQMLEYLKDPQNMAHYMKQREAMGDPAMMKELVTEYIKNPAGLAYLETKSPAIYKMIQAQAARALAPNPVASLPGAGANTRPPV